MPASVAGRCARLAAVLVLLASVGCAGVDDQTAPTSAVSPDEIEPGTTEVSFVSNGYELVGDLELPDGTGPHPAVVLVHGSGPQSRYSTPTSGLVRNAFVDAGYAVLVWDKPGSGDSIGEFDGERTLTQRAEILVDAVDWLTDNPSIDASRIGVWGLSQAGWVMPLALTMTDDISFMIVVSGGAEDSIEQMVFQWTAQATCRGATAAELAVMDTQGPRALKAETYDEYRAAMDQLLAIRDIDRYVGVDIELVGAADWRPWPRDIDAFFDPAIVLTETTIPVLAIFGEHDSQIDPVQGVQAYREALERAGNPDFRVETVLGANHVMRASEGPCGPDSSETAAAYLDLLDEWLENHPA